MSGAYTKARSFVILFKCESSKTQYSGGFPSSKLVLTFETLFEIPGFVVAKAANHSSGSCCQWSAQSLQNIVV